MAKTPLMLFLLLIVSCSVEPGVDGFAESTDDGVGVEGSCVTSYGSCHDEESDTKLGCCELEDTCIYDSFLDSWGCLPPCTTHEECGGCCIYAQLPTGWASVCSPSGTYCQDTGIGHCIDTCNSAQDGICNDGGPGSYDGSCALGTDCLDCGPR